MIANLRPIRLRQKNLNRVTGSYTEDEGHDAYLEFPESVEFQGKNQKDENRSGKRCQHQDRGFFQAVRQQYRSNEQIETQRSAKELSEVGS